MHQVKGDNARRNNHRVWRIKYKLCNAEKEPSFQSPLVMGFRSVSGVWLETSIDPVGGGIFLAAVAHRTAPE